MEVNLPCFNWRGCLAYIQVPIHHHADKPTYSPVCFATMTKQHGVLKLEPVQKCSLTVMLRSSPVLPGICMNFANYFNGSKNNTFMNKPGKEINSVLSWIHRPFCTLDGPVWRNVNKDAESLKPQWTSPSGLTKKSSHIHCCSLVRLRIKKAYENAANSYLFIFGNSIVLYEHKIIPGESLQAENKDACSIKHREIFAFSHHLFIFLLLIYFN